MSPDAGSPGHGPENGSPGGRRRLAVWLALTGGAVAWLLLDRLPVAARLWAAILLVPLPALVSGQHRLSAASLLPRTAVYRSSIVSLWVLAGITALAARFSGFHATDLGVTLTAATTTAAWALAATVAGIVVIFTAHLAGVGTTELVDALVPRDRHEQNVFAGLTVTAGICEELIFRGFLIRVLADASGSLAVAVTISTIVFGWMHTYQGVKGAVGAGLLGGILAVPLLLSGSIVPSIIAHAAIDLLAGIVFAPILFNRDA